jgi:glutamate/tyrosine decarboxylase-like PLP-dependent enzyme
MTTLRSTADHLRRELTSGGTFASVGKRQGVPVVCLKLTPDPETGGERGFTVYDIAERLKEHGWIVPACE